MWPGCDRDLQARHANLRQRDMADNLHGRGYSEGARLHLDDRQ
jgi:hypothetical protein